MLFPTPVNPTKLSLTFQGGFVGTTCVVECLSPEGAWRQMTVVYPEDVNRTQMFDLPEQPEASSSLKLVFEESSDFFGRITLYGVDLF